MAHVNGTITVITPEGTDPTWADVWAYREVLYFMVWRDLRVRYRQMALGAAWAILQPFSTMVLFSLVFGLLAGMPSDGAPYPVFSYAGLVPWTYFAAAVAQGAGSLVGSQSLLAKVYFPRLIVPLAAIIVPLVDAAVSMVMMAVLMAWYGIAPGVAILALPGFALLGTVFSGAVSIWLSALNVKYRDVRFVVPFLIQFGLFATPVAYPSSLVPEGWRWFYALNPMATVVDGFRWVLAGTPSPSAAEVLSSTTAVAVTLWLSLRYFRRMERVFADVL
jgi:lipopolysaccharide transport system permease protein